MGFLNKLLGKTESTATSSTSEFLAQLTQEERVAVSNLSPMLYDMAVREKTGEGFSGTIVTEDERAFQLLAQLDVADLKRLKESVESTLAAEKADSQGDLATTARLYRRTVELNPYDDLALMSYGVTLAQQGHLEEGIEWVEKAVTANPSNVRAFGNLQAMKSARK